MSVAQDGPKSILMSWTPSSNAIGYVIDYASSCRGNNQLLIDGGSTNECRVTGLVDGGIYTVSIVAISDGFPSESVTKIITLMGVNSGTNIYQMLIKMTSLSDNLQVTVKTATSIHLSWPGAEAVGHYLVEWKTASKGDCSCRSGQGGSSIDDSSAAYDIVGLEEDSRYIITLKTINSDGSPHEDHSLIAVMTLEAGEREPMLSVCIPTDLYGYASSSVCSSLFCECIRSDFLQHHCPVGASGLSPPQWRHNRLLSAVWE